MNHMEKSELAIIAVVLAVVVLAALLLGGTDYINSSIPTAQAGIAAPAATMTVNSIGAWLLKGLGILVGLLALVAACFYGYDLLSKRRSGGWVSGPNARWKRDQQVIQPGERKPELADLVMLQMLRQGGGMPSYGPARLPDGEDNQNVEF